MILKLKLYTLSKIKRIGEILSTFRSGKLPTSFHVIPLLDHWKELLELTEPSNWTPHAYYEATKMFVSKTESQRTLKFFKFYLLPKVLKDIKITKKLNYHLFKLTN